MPRVAVAAGSVLLLLIACLLTLTGSALFFYLTYDPSGSASYLLVVSTGVAAGLFAYRCAGAGKFAHVVADLLGLLFTVTAFALLAFGTMSLHDLSSPPRADTPAPGVVVPFSAAMCGLLAGLEIAAALAWLIIVERRRKREQS